MGDSIIMVRFEDLTTEGRFGKNVPTREVVVVEEMPGPLLEKGEETVKQYLGVPEMRAGEKFEVAEKVRVHLSIVMTSNPQNAPEVVSVAAGAANRRIILATTGESPDPGLADCVAQFFNADGTIMHPILKAFVGFFSGVNCELVDAGTVAAFYRVASLQKGRLARSGIAQGAPHLEDAFLVAALLFVVEGRAVDLTDLCKLVGTAHAQVTQLVREQLGKAVVLLSRMGVLHCTNPKAVSRGYGQDKVSLLPWSQVLDHQRVALMIMSLPVGPGGALFWALSAQCQCRLPQPFHFNLAEDMDVVEWFTRFRDFAHYLHHIDGNQIPDLSKEQTEFMHFWGALGQLLAVVRTIVGKRHWLGELSDEYASFKAEGRTILLGSGPPCEPVEVAYFFVKAVIQVDPQSDVVGGHRVSCASWRQRTRLAGQGGGAAQHAC
jgi:hypothetical protein